MSQFFADLDGTTKNQFSFGGRGSITTSDTHFFLYDKEGSFAVASTGPIQARASDATSNTLWGGARITAGGSNGQEGADFGVKLLASPSLAEDYALRFPATPPVAGQVQLLVSQGENLSFVPLATLAAGAVKVEKKVVTFAAAATTPWVTLPPGAEIWRFRIAILQAFNTAGGGATPRFTVGVTGQLGQFMDLTLDDHTQLNAFAKQGAILDYTPDQMAASEAPLVIGFTANGATAGQVALYCEYMIPNV